MVSATQQTQTRRTIRQRRAGRLAKRTRTQQGTPSFPIHPEGYDPTAPDAKKPQGESK